MELKVDKEKKREIVKALIQKNKYLRKTNNASSIFMILGYSSLLFYFCFYSIYAQFDLKAFITTTVLFVIFFVLSTLSKFAVMESIKQDLTERTDERLTYQCEELIYSFRNKLTTKAEDRIRIHIPINKIDEIQCKKCTNKIILTGLFSRKYATNCSTNTMPPHRGHIASEKEINEFVIYDYFEPALYDFLLEQKLNVGNNFKENDTICSPKERM